MEIQTTKLPQYDRQSELIAFDESKAGVKGLIDAGITKIPRIFINEKDKPEINVANGNSNPCFPVIDLQGLDDPDVRGEVVKKVKEACELWGFFQIINHELPVPVMDQMIEGVKRFHEQETEVKKKYYSRDHTKPFQYNSNFYLYKTSAAMWRDSIVCDMNPHPPDPQELPEVCRDIMFEYSKHVVQVGHTVYELLSEALGLYPSYLKVMMHGYGHGDTDTTRHGYGDADFFLNFPREECRTRVSDTTRHGKMIFLEVFVHHNLKDIGCVESNMFVGHYYPPCPEPDLTFGIRSHVDFGLLTILLQDQIGGLQVLHQDQWVNVPPLPGGLIINVGDFIQLITNDKFKSVKHRALSKREGPRISVANFIKPYCSDGEKPRLYGPIKELLTEEEPAIYRETSYQNYEAFYFAKCDDGTTKLPYFKL